MNTFGFLTERENITRDLEMKSQGTDYGRFTTKLDENGNHITEDNIFEKLIGKV